MSRGARLCEYCCAKIESELRMYHCHILEHEQLGMMGVVAVKL